MATIQDIADKLGVSKGTVSKAINNAPDISETLRKTILDTAVEMGYSRLRRQKDEEVLYHCYGIRKTGTSSLRFHHASARWQSPQDTLSMLSIYNI